MALDEVRQEDNRNSPSTSMVYLKLHKHQIKMSVSGADLTSVTFFQVFPQTLQNVNLSLI